MAAEHGDPDKTVTDVNVLLPNLSQTSASIEGYACAPTDADRLELVSDYENLPGTVDGCGSSEDGARCRALLNEEAITFNGNNIDQVDDPCGNNDELSETEEGTLQCQVCFKYIKNAALLEDHLNEEHCHAQRFQCVLCDKSYLRAVNLKSHMEAHSGVTYSCYKCSKTFKTKLAHAQHEKTHMDRGCFQCPVCPKSFLQKGGLKDHMRNHTNDKPYTCAVCNKAYGRFSDLNQHMRSHTGEKPFKCTHAQCDKRFGHRSDLKRHIRTHTGEQPYVCVVCGRGFIQKGQLAVHLSTHGGVERVAPARKYHCTMCDVTCTRGSHLREHMRVHSGEKPYSCSKCPKKFGHGASLKKHMANKHPV